MSLEVGPSLRTKVTAVFNASELTIIAEVALFVLVSISFSYISRTVRCDNSTEIAVWEAAPVGRGIYTV